MATGRQGEPQADAGRRVRPNGSETRIASGAWDVLTAKSSVDTAAPHRAADVGPSLAIPGPNSDRIRPFRIASSSAITSACSISPGLNPNGPRPLLYATLPFGSIT